MKAGTKGMSALLLGVTMLFAGCVGQKGDVPETIPEEPQTPAVQETAETPESGVVNVSYLGHASFILQFDNGVSILTDYGQSRAYGLDSPIYDLGNLVPDVVTYSHTHADHAGGKIPQDISHVLKSGESLNIDGIEITPIPTCEKALGTKDNWSYLFIYKRFKILHLADAQAYIENIEKPEVRQLVKETYPDSYDLLLLTIGGVSDIVEQSEVFLDLLQPRRAIPMHYWSGKDKERFLSLLEEKNRNAGAHYIIEYMNGSKYSFTIQDAANPVTVISLKPGPFEI